MYIYSIDKHDIKKTKNIAKSIYVNILLSMGKPKEDQKGHKNSCNKLLLTNNNGDILVPLSRKLSRIITHILEDSASSDIQQKSLRKLGITRDDWAHRISTGAIFMRILFAIQKKRLPKEIDEDNFIDMTELFSEYTEKQGENGDFIFNVEKFFTSNYSNLKLKRASQEDVKNLGLKVPKETKKKIT